MVDDVKKQIVTFPRIVFIEQGLADLKMDGLFFLLSNEGVCSLLHPVMQEFEAPVLYTRSIERFIHFYDLGKTDDKPGFKGRQQVLKDLNSSLFANEFQ